MSRLIVPLTVLALAALACGGRQARTVSPQPAPPPAAHSSAYVAVADRPAAPPPQPRYEPVEIVGQTSVAGSQEIPDLVGYQTLSDGSEVQVITYVHTYVEAVETYPRVNWAGAWYYNVNGNFVFWNNYWNGWCMYWGPPMGLVYAWNFYYPWVAFSWGVGFYGPGWYWGGVSHIGYHGYGAPPSYYRRPVRPGRPHPGGSLGNAKGTIKAARPVVGGRPSSAGKATVAPRPAQGASVSPSGKGSPASARPVAPQKALSARPAPNKPGKAQAVPPPSAKPSQVGGAKFRPPEKQPSGKVWSASKPKPGRPGQPANRPKATYRPTQPKSARPVPSPQRPPTTKAQRPPTTKAQRPPTKARPARPVPKSSRPSKPSARPSKARPARRPPPARSARPARPSRPSSARPSPRPSSRPARSARPRPRG
ncbi:MAG: hypothetical protein B7733_10665 [Myxococcales bacterium FL481]|nr:MAG: hypothetical protein B7733_10665 [Myxococcales bacterium FL481]